MLGKIFGISKINFGFFALEIAKTTVFSYFFGDELQNIVMIEGFRVKSSCFFLFFKDRTKFVKNFENF